MKKIVKVLVLFLFVLIVSSNSLFALNFRIDNAKVRLNMPPGWSDGGVINVENRSNEPIEMRVYAGDWVYSDQDGSKTFMPAATHPRSCADWIKFYPADFTLPGFGAQKVNYVVEVPVNSVGGHYAVLFFEVGGGGAWDESKGVMVQVYNRIGSLFYVETAGFIERKAQLSDLKIYARNENIEIEGLFENVGNVDIATEGTFDIIDREGLILTRGEFNKIYTMPQDTAKLNAKGEVASGFAQGRYDVILTFDLDGGILVKEYQLEVSGAGEIVSVKEIE